MNELQGNYNNILQSIAQIQLQCKARTEPARLIAVSKTIEAARCKNLLMLGHRQFGENRVQEAREKWPALRAEYRDIELHLIGPLQSNKIDAALDLFEVIQTLDREKIARLLAKAEAKGSNKRRYYIQVNIGEEPQKAGIAPQQAVEFTNYCRNDLGLAVEGLMCIPPQHEASFIYFALLKKLAKICNLAKLSMGMSQDYQTALAFGATDIRVGSALFGQRD